MLTLEKYAERGELPDRLPISAIAALHPEGESFAQALLSAWAAHEYRRHLHESPDAFIPLDCPPPSDDEPGLPAMIEDAVMLATFAEHRGLSPDSTAKSPLTNLHEWEWEPRIGEFVFVRRDDLKAWLIEREAWPLPSDAKLRLWWSKARKPKGRRRRQHDRIIEVANALGLGLYPETKAMIRAECLKDTRLFTESSFDHAWKTLDKNP